MSWGAAVSGEPGVVNWPAQRRSRLSDCKSFGAARRVDCDCAVDVERRQSTASLIVDDALSPLRCAPRGPTDGCRFGASINLASSTAISFSFTLNRATSPSPGASRRITHPRLAWQSVAQMQRFRPTVFEKMCATTQKRIKSRFGF